MDLKGKVALITGASRGIGKQVALRLARDGVHLVLAARTADSSESIYPGTIHQTAAEVRALGVKALAVRCDLARRADVERLCASAIEEFGRVDILINNAAFFGPGHYDPFLKMTLEQWDTMLAVDLTAAVVTCRLLLPGMIERQCGIIICMTSQAATEDVAPGGRGGISPGYPAAKAALNRFVRCVAREFEAQRIAIIAVEPGFTMTERTAIILPQQGVDLSRTHPMEVPVSTVHYLCACSDPMPYSGQVVIARDFAREHRLA